MEHRKDELRSADQGAGAEVRFPSSFPWGVAAYITGTAVYYVLLAEIRGMPYDPPDPIDASTRNNWPVGLKAQSGHFCRVGSMVISLGDWVATGPVTADTLQAGSFSMDTFANDKELLDNARVR